MKAVQIRPLEIATSHFNLLDRMLQVLSQKSKRLSMAYVRVVQCTMSELNRLAQAGILLLLELA